MKALSGVIATLVIFSFRAAAQDAPPPPPGMDEAMMKMIEAGSPNRNHDVLKSFVGYWNTESTFWMEGPDKPPVMNRGNAHFGLVLGGRFLKLDYKGSFMGQEMVGVGYYGYDNMQNKYTQLWIDNTSTAFFPASGTLDEKAGTLTLTGPADDPATGEMGKTVKYVIGIPKDDRFVFEMYDMSIPGPNKKTGEMVYIRAAEHN